MKYQIFLISFLIIQSLTALGQTNSIEQQSYHQLDSLFNSHYKSDKTGATLAIIKNGETIYKNAKGLANIEYQLPITDSTTFNIASVSKQFTTYLALLLEEEGKLSFNDDIRIHLPELNHLPNKITIKDLTNHTHGLANSYELADLKGILPQGTMTHQQVVKMLLNIKQTNFNLADKYEYNNTGYILLAEIIERVGKMPFKEQLKQRIFLPLGMNHTQAVDDINIVVPNKAYSYRFVNDQYQNNPIKISTIGSSGINSTIDDMILWAKNYQNPTVGNRIFYNKMEEATYLNSGKKIEYGLGLQFGTYKGLDIVFHGGGTVAYRSYILHLPKHGLSITILANTADFSSLDVVYGAIDILLKNHIKIEPVKTKRLSNKQLKEYEGTYQFQPGIYFNIIAEKGNLYFQSHGAKEKDLLPHINKNAFVFPHYPHSKLVFHENTFDFQIADFTYECLRTSIDKVKPKEINLADFSGLYRNKEHNITFELIVDNHQLIVKRASGNDVILNSFSLTSFYFPGFGKLDFNYDSDGLVSGFMFSGQNLRGIVFEKG